MKNTNEFEEFEGTLPLDLFQKGDEFIILVPVAGVKPEDIEILITENEVTIKGERKREEKAEEDNYFYQECFWGSFKKNIKLPLPVDIEKSKAELKNGILKITLRRLKEGKAKSIKIKPSHSVEIEKKKEKLD